MEDICRYVSISVRPAVRPSVRLSVCLSVCLCTSRVLFAGHACVMWRAEVWVQPSRDTVVLGNTDAIFFSTLSGDVARCLRSLAERYQVSPRGSPNRHFLAPAGTGAGEKPPKAHKGGKAREPTGGRPGGRGGWGGQPAGESPGTLQKCQKS